MNTHLRTPPPQAYRNSPLLQVLQPANKARAAQKLAQRKQPGHIAEPVPEHVRAPEPALEQARASEPEPEPEPAVAVERASETARDLGPPPLLPVIYPSLDHPPQPKTYSSSYSAQASQPPHVPAPEPPAQTSWDNAAYPMWHGQPVPPMPYEVMPPPAHFIHELPQRMEPNTYSPLYTTPNGMLQYYVFANESGRAKVSMNGSVANMQALYQELGCTMPRYRGT